MRATPRSGGRRSPFNPSRCGVAKPRIGPVGAGVLAVLAGFPVLAQVGAFPPAEPAQEERLPFETEAAPAAEPSPPADIPVIPPSPFGLSPDVFPGIFSRPDRPAQDPRTTPFEPDVSTAPERDPQTGTPVEPPPGLAGAPQTTPPAFVSPPYGYGSLAPGLFLPPSAGLPALPPNAPPSTALAPLRPGALPVQAYNLRAPPILIQPLVSVFGGYTDNPNSTPNGFSDVYTRVYGNTAISVDTVRLQGQLVGGLNYLKYARATDQDRLDVNLLAYGLGTVVQDHIFIDGRAAITQTSQSGGLIFAAPQLIPNSDLTQVYTFSVTPIARQSFDGYFDGDLRYNFAGSLFQNPNNANTTTFTNLNNAIRNQATATLATGRRFTLFGSRLTLDAMKIDSQSASRSTQLRAYDDMSYQFNQKFAGVARIGYENLDYPLQPSADFQGPTWELGGRYTPSPGNYFIGTYGRRDGLYGFTGALRYTITERTVALASFTRNRTSQQQQIFNNLNASSVDPYGNVINQVTGLPIALGSTNFGASNAIFSYRTANAGLQTSFERNSIALFAFLSQQSPLGTPIGTAAIVSTTSDSTSGGVNLNWARSLTPRLNSNARVGFTRLTSTDQNTLTAGLSMSYILNEKLTAVLNYQFINVDSSTVGGSYRRNQVEIGLTRSF